MCNYDSLLYVKGFVNETAFQATFGHFFWAVTWAETDKYLAKAEEALLLWSD